jgi:hypothetical protein
MLPEPSILTYLMVPFGKYILLGGTLLQILNETKHSLFVRNPPTQGIILKTKLKNLNLYLAEYAEFFKTNSNYRTDMRFRCKLKTLALYFYSFDLDLC